LYRAAAGALGLSAHPFVLLAATTCGRGIDICRASNIQLMIGRLSSIYIGSFAMQVSNAYGVQKFMVDDAGEFGGSRSIGGDGGG